MGGRSTFVSLWGLTQQNSRIPHQVPLLKNSNICKYPHGVRIKSLTYEPMEDIPDPTQSCHFGYCVFLGTVHSSLWQFLIVFPSCNEFQWTHGKPRAHFWSYFFATLPYSSSLSFSLLFFVLFCFFVRQDLTELSRLASNSWAPAVFLSSRSYRWQPRAWLYSLNFAYPV